MKFFLRFSIVVNIALPLAANELYYSVRVWSTDQATLTVLHNEGIPLDHVRIKAGVYIDVLANEEQTARLSALGIPYDILITDMTQYFLDRNVPDITRDFELGSMLGNYTFSELVDKMDTLATLYPSIVSVKDSIGASIEGRTIWAFKVSDNPEQDELEPEILFTGITHAREPLSMMNQFYFVQWLCENYSSDPVAQYLVDERALWFIPVINPDGYVYNETIAPNGGGMHRKNRRDTGCGDGTQRGIDLNRNYGYEWGADNSGSSPNPCSDTFRGDSAFSEPETQAVRDFILNNDFSNVLHYHSYSNVLIHSWGDGSLPDEPDLTTIREIGWEMTKYNGYQVGTGYETIGYGVNGDAVDWSYGDAGLIAYTPEIGSYQDYFWPPENRVIPLCEDQLYANQIFGFVGGADHIVYAVESSEQVEDTIHFDITIQNRGLKNSDGDVVINAESYNSVSYVLDYDSNIGELAERDTVQVHIVLVAPGDHPDGTEVGFLFTVNDNSSFVRTDTIKALIGTPVSIFDEDAEEDLAQWNTYAWGLTAANSYSGDYSITDSPQGNYADNDASAIATVNPINLSGLDNPFVNYAAKWDIENNYDFVRFEISTDGMHWTSLEGMYTETGAGQGTQDTDDHGYDGTSDWVEEFIDLSSYTDETSVYFQFILTADGGVTGDGFYFDDFTIQGYLNYVPGDLMQNGELDIFDVLALVELILAAGSLNEYQQLLADVNFDGIINLDDVLAMVDIILSN